MRARIVVAGLSTLLVTEDARAESAAGAAETEKPLTVQEVERARATAVTVRPDLLVRFPTGGRLQYPGTTWGSGVDLGVALKKNVLFHVSGGSLHLGDDFFGFRVAPIGVGYLVTKAHEQGRVKYSTDVELLCTLLQIESMSGKRGIAYRTQSSVAIGLGAQLYGGGTLYLGRGVVGITGGLAAGFDTRYVSFQDAGATTGDPSLAFALVGRLLLGLSLGESSP